MLFGAAATVLSPRLPQPGAAVTMQNSARLGRLGAFHVDGFRRSSVQSITIKPRFSKAHYFQVKSQMLSVSKQHPSGISKFPATGSSCSATTPYLTILPYRLHFWASSASSSLALVSKYAREP